MSSAYTVDPSYRLGYSQGATQVVPSASSSNNMMLPPTFTQEQYNRICQMLKQDDFKTSNTASDNMTGNSRSLDVINDSEEWIIDTGATNHMTSNIELLNKHSIIKTKVSRKIFLPNGEISEVQHTGTTDISAQSTLHNVLHVPQFKCNLMSVSKATRQLQCFAIFFPNFYLFQDLYNGKVKEIGRERNELYFLIRQSLP